MINKDGKSIPNKKIYIGDEPFKEETENTDKTDHTVKPPPLKDQIISFAKAFGGWVKEGAPIVTPQEYTERLAMCHTCSFYDGAKDRCNQCGCKMQLKARMKTSECPIKKWASDKEKDGKK